MTPDYKIEADGIDKTGKFKGRLLSITITDNAGGESDTLQIEVNDPGGEVELPKTGAILAPALGYLETGLTPRGLFKVDDVTSKGGSSGQTLSISAKSLDTRETAKEKRSKHYDKKTLGDILKSEAGEHGLQLVISPELASFNYDFVLKKSKSFLQFGRELARDHDAAFKIAGNKAIFVKRGKGLSGSGLALPVILVALPGNLISWSIKPEMGRARYQGAQSVWYDRDTAKHIVEEVLGSEGPAKYLRTQLRQNKDQAKSAAGAKKNENDRGKGGGTFTIEGDPSVSAECHVLASGCRTGVDGLWLGKTVTDSFKPGGYSTQIQVEALGAEGG